MHRKIFDDPEMKEQFYQFVCLLYPGITEEHGSLLKAAFANIDSFRGKKSGAVLKRTLDHLLDKDFSDEELERAWRSTSPSYGMSGTGPHRMFLEACRNYLRTGKYEPEDGTGWPIDM